METIFEKISMSDSKRPVYTSYELSQLVKTKRLKEQLNEEEFALKHRVDTHLLQQVEEANRIFSPSLYRVCSKILDITIDDIVAYVEDDIDDASYRISGKAEGIQNTVELANKLFNEIIMQKKISIH